ncbi:hypothetical protein BURPS668_A0659 [Burkholderia pseudomallei 668]|nr:hypothetical protein BURPS668_A0659 [Burkholderia pseudomallei 668]
MACQKFAPLFIDQFKRQALFHSVERKRRLAAWVREFCRVTPHFAPVSHRWDASGIMGDTAYCFSAVCAFCIY